MGHGAWGMAIIEHLYEATMKCPVCGAIYRPTKGSRETGKNEGDKETREITNAQCPMPNAPSITCKRCKVDLSDLFSLHDQAIWDHREALYLLSQGRYSEAAMHNNQAIALYSSNADFHALAGKLWALQGEFREAIASWQQALKFDPENAIACDCLQMIQLMAKNNQT
ncbi:tetratricopeptide repeat protein [Nostoc sp. CALU 546]|uniref:tetratricopeptide repeat protein n=1 Tax=Nostoc sp. CALU 546 TaxID=1867241 RepID=UPI003B66BCBC